MCERESVRESVRESEKECERERVCVRECERERESVRETETWTEREQRICRHCDLQQIEDEKHFLMMCPKYLHVIPSFTELSDSEKMPFLLGDDNTAALAAKYVLTIHNVRCST